MKDMRFRFLFHCTQETLTKAFSDGGRDFMQLKYYLHLSIYITWTSYIET